MDINQVPQIQTQIQPVKNKSHNALKTIFILAMIILAGMIGAFYFILNQDKLALENQLVNLQKQQERNDLQSSFSNTDFDKAIAVGEKLINEDPEDVTNYILLANSYLQKGSVTFNEEENADIAISVLEKAISIDSRVSEVYRVMGYAYEIKQDYKQALTMYETAIEIDPLNDVAFGARGHMYFLTGNETLAESDLKKSLEINPDNDKALVDLAGIYFRTKKDSTVDIEEIILRAISISENDNVKSEAFQLLGSLYYSQKLYQKAEKQFAQSVSLEERLAMSWVGIAMSKLMQLDVVSEEEFDASVRVVIDAIEKSLTLSPNLARAYLAEGLLSGYLSEFEAEKEAYQKALSVISSDITLSKVEKEELKLELENLMK